MPVSSVPVRVWIAIAAGLALLTLLGTQQWKIRDLRADVAEARAEVSAAGRTLDQCKASVDLQNQAVAQWRAEAAARSKAAQDALRKAEGEKVKAQHQVRRMNAIVMTGDECADIRAVVDAARAGGL